MNIFCETDYRRILKGLLDEQRRDNPAASYQDLALAMGIPKSYLSKVMHGRADISVDQMFLATAYFRLKPEERDYLDLLLQLARCNVEGRRQILNERIEATRRTHLDTATHLKAEVVASESGVYDYYLDPIHQLVHAALDIPAFQTSLRNLADHLGISLKRIQDAVRNLERLGIIGQQGERLVVKRAAIHLPRGSSVFDAWRAQLRLLGLQRAQAIPKEDHYAFSVVFSAGQNSDQIIKSRFLDFLKRLETEVSEARSERVYQLNFDILPWT